MYFHTHYIVFTSNAIRKGRGATTSSQINIFKKKEKWNQVNYTSTVSVEFQDRSEYHST